MNIRMKSARPSFKTILSAILCILFIGCARCEDKGDAAVQMLLPHLTQDVVSNLVHEAAVCIADASSQSVAQAFYMPPWAEAPVAHGLEAKISSGFHAGTGPTLVVRNRGDSAPYFAVGVPIHPSAGLCLWHVYVCIKPGGGFAKDDKGNWLLSGRGSSATPLTRLNDEALVYAEMQNF